MNIRDQLAAVIARHQKNKTARYKLTSGQRNTLRQKRRKLATHHHTCEARGTATKNTKANLWNVRASKSRRPEGRFQKLRAFKREFNIA